MIQFLSIPNQPISLKVKMVKSIVCSDSNVTTFVFGNFTTFSGHFFCLLH